MAVPDWPPTRIMKDLFDKKYKAKSGNTVKLDVDFIPWPDYYTRLNASLTSGEKKYHMAVSNSQWLGAFIEGGYYLQAQRVGRRRPGPDRRSSRTCIRSPSKPMRPIPISPRTLRLPADAGHLHQLLSQGHRSATTKSRRTSRRSPTPSCPARPEEMDNVDWGPVRADGRVLHAQERREARRPKRSTTTSTASPSRPAKPTTSSTMQINAFIWQYGGNVWDETKEPEGPCRGRRELARGR